MTPAELGAKDGAAWFKRHPECTGLQAATAAGEHHWEQLDQRQVTIDDCVEYGQAFLRACVWTVNA